MLPFSPFTPKKKQMKSPKLDYIRLLNKQDSSTRYASMEKTTGGGGD